MFAYLGKLRKEGRTLIPVSINVSRLHAYDEKLTETLLRLREEYDVLPEYVPLELTESAFLEDEVGMYRRMESLRERGFLVSMDDFGTGYSTMNMLKNQTLDEIKIDREFILDLEKDKSHHYPQYHCHAAAAGSAYRHRRRGNGRAEGVPVRL